MTINNVSANTSVTNITNKAASAVRESKNIENELTSKQQHLNRLSSDSDMTAKEKDKERREIQREIAELNRRLMQERMEEKAEAKEEAKEQEKKRIIKEEMFEKADSKDKTDSKAKTEDTDSEEYKASMENAMDKDLPLVTLKNIVTASSMVEQNEVTEKASAQIEGQKDILQAEIQSDTLYGTDTTAKKEALSELRKKETLQIEVLNQQPEQITPNLNFDSKIIIREH